MSERGSPVAAAGRRMIGRLESWYQQATDPAGGDRRRSGDARAHLARLKRCAGMTVSEAASERPEGLLTFSRLVPTVPSPTGEAGGDREERRIVQDVVEARLFLIATLFPLAPNPPRERPAGEKPQPDWSTLGTHLAELAKKQAEKGSVDDRLERFEAVGKRLAVLLDATREELPFRLRQTVRLLAQNEIRVNWVRLMDDLEGWDHEDRRVRRRWASDFWKEAPGQARADEPGDEGEENEDAS